jgi:hypothetical protein
MQPSRRGTIGNMNRDGIAIHLKASKDFKWDFLKVQPDTFALYRDGRFMWERSSKQIRMDARFRSHYAELMDELGRSGVATFEIPKLRMGWPAF